MAEPRRRLIAVPSAPAADALIAALPNAVIVLDPDGCIAGVNAAAEALLNAGVASLLHKPLGIVLRLPPACNAGLREEALFAAYDCMVEPVRGTKARVDFHAAPVAGFAGWRLLTLATSAAAHAMSERRGASRAATGVATLLAHEIKNPLSGIRGAAQLLERDDAGDRGALTALIRDEVDRIARLIDNMEAFTDTRERPPRAENIYAILDHVRALADSGFGERIDILDSYDPSLPPVLVDRDALVQIVLNLLKNAAEAAPSGKRATAWLTTAYRHGVAVPGAEGRRRSLPIELCVIDDGPGPPPEIVEHLFEPFVTSKVTGRGLGLALVDKLVRDNGGRVQFAREGSPERTVFRLLLPRAI